MSDIKNIRTQEISGSNSGTDEASSVSDSGQGENSSNLAGLEALRSKITSHSSVASNAKSQAIECTTLAQKYKTEAENGSSVSAIKQAIEMAREMIQRAKEQIKIMKAAITQIKEAKTELAQKSKKVNAPQEGLVEGNNQNSFLFNQKSDASV